MAETTPVIYRFSGFVRVGDGALEELSVTISAPRPSGKGDSVCELLCPFLREKPFDIYGVDHDQALSLARRFVEACVEHENAEIVDIDGHPVELPPLPTAES